MSIYKINFLFLILSSIFLLFLLFNFFIEREKRASFILTSIIGVNSLIWTLFLWSAQTPFAYYLNIVVLCFIFIFCFVSLIPYFPKATKREDLSSIFKYDERDIMFARNNLSSHPELYSLYYGDKPETEKIDIEIHKKGSLTDQSKIYYDKYLTPLYDSAFTMIDKIRENFSIEINKERIEIDEKKITDKIKYIARTYGGVDVGITKLKPYHFYSHKGRHPEGWGEKVTNDHKWGIAIIVPMDVEMIKKAPTVHTIIESSKAYVEAAKIANLVETYIKSFGYDAKAHTDGNYETLCVPIAIDAGMGELSRMGIMIHKEFGPSIRISIVTTEMELIPTPAKHFHIDSFCKICKKCSVNCPSGSIEKGNEPYSRGFKHWYINQEKCFSFWKNIGTDCGFCLKVCPYTKPNTFFHRLIRFYISRNPINQHIALLADDLLIGRKFKIPTSN